MKAKSKKASKTLRERVSEGMAHFTAKKRPVKREKVEIEGKPVEVVRKPEKQFLTKPGEMGKATLSENSPRKRRAVMRRGG